MAYKYYGIKDFDAPNGLMVRCRAQQTRYGFRHLAILYKDHQEVAAAKASYYNRTWEAYEYQSVIIAVINKAEKSGVISAQEVKEAKKWADEDHKDWRGLKSIAMVARMGEIFGQNQKEKNDWKARMIKAGLEGRGLIMPDDWDQLPEDEKTRRLDAVINELK